jgi:hypothetical protein
LGEGSSFEWVTPLVHQDRLPPILILVSVESDPTYSIIIEEEARLFPLAGDRDLPTIEVCSKVLKTVEFSRNRPVDDVSDDAWPSEPVDPLKETDTIVVRGVKHEEKATKLEFCTVYADMRRIRIGVAIVKDLNIRLWHIFRV